MHVRVFPLIWIDKKCARSKIISPLPRHENYLTFFFSARSSNTRSLTFHLFEAEFGDGYEQGPMSVVLAVKIVLSLIFLFVWTSLPSTLPQYSQKFTVSFTFVSTSNNTPAYHMRMQLRAVSFIPGEILTNKTHKLSYDVFANVHSLVLRDSCLGTSATAFLCGKWRKSSGRLM